MMNNKFRMAVASLEREDAMRKGTQGASSISIIFILKPAGRNTGVHPVIPDTFVCLDYFS